QACSWRRPPAAVAVEDQVPARIQADGEARRRDRRGLVLDHERRSRHARARREIAALVDRIVDECADRCVKHAPPADWCRYIGRPRGGGWGGPPSPPRGTRLP